MFDGYVASLLYPSYKTDIQSLALTITKGQVKLSKKGDRAKVDIKVEGKYGLDNKNVKVQIKSAGMDFVLAPVNGN